MVKVTLREQITSDIRTFIEIADEILGAEKTNTTQDNYYKLLDIIYQHTRYCLENYQYHQEDDGKTQNAI